MWDHLKLHGVVLAWGLTAVLGRLIDLPAMEIVVLRTALAVAALWVVARARGVSLRISAGTAWQLLGTGALIGIHWILFFSAGHASNATISVAGLPTTLVWTALVEWLLFRKPLRGHELALGLLMIPAVWLILSFEFRYSTGFLLSVGSAVVGSLFAALNGQLARRHHYLTISFYQMGAACLISAAALPIFDSPKLPSWSDLRWLLVLSLVCTVYAYTAYIELLRRLSVFTINLVYNLEPLYSMALAALLLGEHRDLSGGFYLGASIILAAVLAYPFLQRSGRISTATPPYRACCRPASPAEGA